MINVNVMPAQNQGKNFPEDLKSCTYYSCKRKTSGVRQIFILVPLMGKPNEKRIVIYFSSEISLNGLVWDFFSTFKDDYHDFQEIKDADLTFYV